MLVKLVSFVLEMSVVLILVEPVISMVVLPVVLILVIPVVVMLLVLVLVLVESGVLVLVAAPLTAVEFAAVSFSEVSLVDLSWCPWFCSSVGLLKSPAMIASTTSKTSPTAMLPIRITWGDYKVFSGVCTSSVGYQCLSEGICKGVWVLGRLKQVNMIYIYIIILYLYQ